MTKRAFLGGFLWGATLAVAAPASEVANAAMRRNSDAVRALIEAKSNVNAPQADGATALHWAVYYDDVALADVLIRAGADVRAANREGATPLSLASINGDPQMIERLLQAGASPNERLPNGETPLMMAARTGNPAAMAILLDRKADVNAKENLRGTTALMWAVEQRHSSAARLLIERGADVNAKSSSSVQRGAAVNVAQTASQRAATKGISDVRRGASAAAPPVPADPADQGAGISGARGGGRQSGGLTALLFAAREGDLDSARLLVAAGARVNQASVDGWTPLLMATQNRHYRLALFLLEKGADPNLANLGGWTPLYLATDNRNIEGGEYPVRQPDLDHLEFIAALLAHKADPNMRAKDNTETRTNFTQQWLNEDGATPFVRAAQSGDVPLMKLLYANGADPKLATANGTTALMATAGIGWVEGVTFEWSPEQSLEAAKLCLDLGIDVNAADSEGRMALHGAAHKGRNEVVELLVARGAKLDARDNGSRDSIAGALLGRTWLPVDYADGLVRVGVQSAIPHPETASLLRRMMAEKGLPVPPPLSDSICLTSVCK